MTIAILIIVFAFVVSVLALVGYTIFEISPFGRHSDHYRDPRRGRGGSRAHGWTESTPVANG